MAGATGAVFPFGWFSSGRDQAAIDLLAAAQAAMVRGFIPGRIAYVFCDREPGETPAADAFLNAVRARELPLVTLSSRKLRQQLRSRAPGAEAARDDFDRKVLELVAGYDARIVVLAGYMLIASPRLCRELLLLNLHPAVPGGPQGTWQQVMWQLMEAEAAAAGAMMHLATPELDQGPPVTYCRLSLRGPDFDPWWQAYRRKRAQMSLAAIQAAEGEAEPLFARIRAAQLAREFPLILLTLKNLAAGRLRLTPRGVEAAGVLVPGGFEITDQVEEFLQQNT